MRRRDVITLLVGLSAIWPHASIAETSRTRRIGMLLGLAEADPEMAPRITAFRQGLEELGWSEERNLHIDYRWTSGASGRMQVLAKELVALQPDVLIASSSPTAAALLRETRTTPIVFVTAADPIGDGFVASLARPGGSATGFTNNIASMAGKWVELLKEVAPHVTRIAVMFNPDTAPGGAGSYFLGPLETAAGAMKMKSAATPVRDVAGIDQALASIGREPGGGLIVMPDNFTAVYRAPLIAAAARNRVPAVYPFRYFATDGGLVGYGADLHDLYRRTATYVDRILKGTSPGDLPVQAPAKFELVVNLRAAKALNLTVPRILLARADEVIE